MAEWGSLALLGFVMGTRRRMAQAPGGATWCLRVRVEAFSEPAHAATPAVMLVILVAAPAGLHSPAGFLSSPLRHSILGRPSTRRSTIAHALAPACFIPWRYAGSSVLFTSFTYGS